MPSKNTTNTVTPMCIPALNTVMDTKSRVSFQSFNFICSTIGHIFWLNEKFASFLVNLGSPIFQELGYSLGISPSPFPGNSD